MQTSEYQLNEIEADIRAEDFRETSFWRKFVRDHGPAPLIDLINHVGGGRLYVPDHDQATKGARKRKRNKDFGLS